MQTVINTIIKMILSINNIIKILFPTDSTPLITNDSNIDFIHITNKREWLSFSFISAKFPF